MVEIGEIVGEEEQGKKKKKKEGKKEKKKRGGGEPSLICSKLSHQVTN